MTQPDPKRNSTALTSIGLVLSCTVIGAGAQFLLRFGARNAAGDSLLDVLSSWPVLAGYFCLTINTGLFILALRKGQLSVLYPIISVTYVWVILLSPILLNESINSYKLVGVGLIVFGVWSIGLGSRS